MSRLEPKTNLVRKGLVVLLSIMEEVLKRTLFKDVPKQELSQDMFLNFVGDAMEDLKIIQDHPDAVILPVVLKVVLYVFT